MTFDQGQYEKNVGELNRILGRPGAEALRAANLEAAERERALPDQHTHDGPIISLHSLIRHLINAHGVEREHLLEEVEDKGALHNTLHATTPPVVHLDYEMTAEELEQRRRTMRAGEKDEILGEVLRRILDPEVGSEDAFCVSGELLERPGRAEGTVVTSPKLSFTVERFALTMEEWDIIAPLFKMKP